jgi:fatty acid desaturase
MGGSSAPSVPPLSGPFRPFPAQVLRSKSPGYTAGRVPPPRELLLPTPLPRLLALALFDWAVIAGCWAFLWVGPWWTAIALWPLIGGRLHALGVVLHELAHAGRQPGALAVLVEALSGWPVCTSVEAMRAHHLRHHARTNQASDPYFQRFVRWGVVKTFFALLVMVPFWAVRSVLGALSHLVPPLRPHYARLLLGRDAADVEGTRAEVSRCAKSDVFVALTAAGLVTATALFPLQVAWGFWIPLVFTSAFNAVRAFEEHTTEEVPDGSREHVLRTPRDHSVGAVSRAFVYPHFIGLHRVHHLHPAAGLVHLRALDGWYRAQGVLG